MPLRTSGWWCIYFIGHRIHLVIDCVAKDRVDDDCNCYENRSANGVLREFGAIFISKKLFQSVHLDNSISGIVSETG